MRLVDEYSDLRFTRKQLVLTEEEALLVAKDFWGTTSLTAAQVTDRDRAFLQAVLIIAMDKSEKAGILFDLFSAFMSAAPSASMKKLVKGFAKKTAKRWFRKYVREDPEYSAAGKAAIQSSAFTTEWRLRIGLGDPSELTNFLAD